MLDLSSQDLDLLRRYEPILYFNQGETYYPLGVERYLKECSLWIRHANGEDEKLLLEGEVTLEALACPRPAEFGAVQYLRFSEQADLNRAVEEQTIPEALQSFGFRPQQARLARVGYGSRLLDALFSFILFLRGRVPGDIAQAAAVVGRKIQKEQLPHVYYGRVVRNGKWVALQYWFFYPFNNWRTGFYGVNDHEADWEMVTLYLNEHTDGSLTPEWAAYSAHDFSGDDLRRRWDDVTELEIRDGHPVVYIGAGSHAAYFRPGEYITEVEIAFFRPLIRMFDWVRGFWTRTLRQAGVQPRANAPRILRIPFVDYARGDGVSIGPGQTRIWEPVVVSPPPAWMSQYRGLWGWYVRDPFGGEDAPAGPMFNRDGSVRRAWYDPFAWSGIDKVTPPNQELDLIEERRQNIEVRQLLIQNQITDKSQNLHMLSVELASLREHPHLASLHTSTQQQLKQASTETQLLSKEFTENQALYEALALRSERLKRGEGDDPQLHLRHKATPSTSEELRFGRGAALWGAMSIGLLFIGFVLLLIFAREYALWGLISIFGMLIFIEAIFRRRVFRLITGLTILVAVFSAFILIYEFFWPGLALLVLLASIYLIWENIRELRHR